MSDSVKRKSSGESGANGGRTTGKGTNVALEFLKNPFASKKEEKNSDKSVDIPNTTNAEDKLTVEDSKLPSIVGELVDDKTECSYHSDDDISDEKPEETPSLNSSLDHSNDSSSSYSDPYSDIKEREIEFQKILGQGTYGAVYRGVVRGKQVAIKILSEVYSQQLLQDFKHEVDILKTLRHENVVLFMGTCISAKGQLMIITEYLPYDLHRTLLAKNGPQIETTYLQRLRMLKDVALALTWMHSCNPMILHLDLKPANMLMDENGTVKVCDLGESILKMKHQNKIVHKPVGSPIYMAPEMYSGKFDEKADVYSFAIVAWEIFSLKLAFDDVKTADELRRKVVDLKQRPAITHVVNARLRTLLEKCWDADPSKRPPFSEITKAIDQVILEETIPDPEGKNFWKNNMKDNIVPWKDIKNAFNGMFNNSKKTVGVFIQLECLREVLAQGMLIMKPRLGARRGEMVSIEAFGRVVGAFGPFDSKFLFRVYSACYYESYHGDIDQVEAVRRLNVEKKAGSFLIRMSQNNMGCFVMSRISLQNTIIHHTIYHRNNVYTFQNSNFESLADLLEVLKNGKLGKEYTSPCIGSKFGKEFIVGIKDKLQNPSLPDYGYASRRVLNS